VVLRRVADILRARGHRVFTPTLTGVGERSHLAHSGVNCSTHIQDIVNVIKWEQLNEVVLCGHSYGGMVVGGVADALPERIASLVYLDAAIPENGKSLFDLMNAPEFASAILNGTVEHGGELARPSPPHCSTSIRPMRRWWMPSAHHSRSLRYANASN